jgi:hypothetical protein
MPGIRSHVLATLYRSSWPAVIGCHERWISQGAIRCSSGSPIDGGFITRGRMQRRQASAASVCAVRSWPEPRSRCRRLWPWVRRASAAGVYVVLDLQPGLTSLLAQAKRYQRLLALPDVGLAIDPEWKLHPGQRPLQQIGSVSTAEINSVIRWLADLTARLHLPQKLLVRHQYGQGTPADKLQTWHAVTGAAPAGVFFGWKNFLVKDHPMLSPAQTMANTPQPVMISYQ